MPEIDRLEIAIQAEATRASAELDKLIGKLNILSSSLSSLKMTGLDELSNSVAKLSISMESISNTKTASFTRLSNNIQKLGNINTGNMQSIASSIGLFTNSLDSMNTTTDNIQQISNIVNSVSKFGSVSMQRAATNLPLLGNALRSFMTTLSTAPNVSSNIINMTNAMANLSQFGSKYNATINSMSRASKALTMVNNNVSHSARNMASSMTFSFSKLLGTVYAIRRAVGFLGNSIESSMDFTETINLFDTSFKKIGMEAAQKAGHDWGSEAANQFAVGFIDDARVFNNMLTESLSLDPSILMNYQAMFASMTNAFGMASESVMDLSKSFTMLGLDLSSLFNSDVETAMTKLRAGLAGEAEPLRQWGIDITEATLKMTALNYGIKDSISKMSMAAKTQLRWLAIMDQAEVAFGDMAKTIDAPANQLRVLQQQWNNLSRSIGNVFMPVISTVLPYVNALIIALRRMIDTLARAVGFELPDYSDTDIYKDITGGISGIGDSADDSQDKVNKLKKALLGIDELNILSEGKDKLSSSVGNGSGYPVLDGAINDKTASYMEKFNKELASMSSKAEELANKIEPKLRGFIKFLDDISPALAGIAAAFVTYKIITWFTSLASGIGALSMTPTGVIAIAIGAIASLVFAIHKYYDKLVQKDLAGRFGDITLSLEEIEEIAKRLTDSKYAAKIDVYVEEKVKLKELEDKIEKDLKALNKLNWKVSVGLKLTEGEKEQYKSTIESFIKNSEEYIEQKHYVVSLALSATITGNDTFLKEMQALTDEYFNGSRAEMETLGKKLRDTMDNAFADGILDEHEQKTIMNLQKEMSEIVQSLADSEFKAKIHMLTVDYGNVDITAESFKQLNKKIQDITDERLKKIEEANYTVLTNIEQAYTVKMKNATTETERKQLQNEKNALIDTYVSEFASTKATIVLEGLTFSNEKLHEKYSEELKKTGPIVRKGVKDAVEEGMYWGFQDISQDKDGVLKDAYSLPVERLASDMSNFYKSQLFDTVSTSARKGAKELFSTLSPTKDDIDKIFNDNVNTGKKVPQALSKGLTDKAEIGIIAGDMDSINFMLGQKLSTDKGFLELLAKSDEAGKKLDKALIAGLKSGIPDLKLQGDNLIFNLDDAIKTASGEMAKKNIPEHSKTLISGFNGPFKNDTSTSKTVSGWLSGISNTFSNFKLPDLKVGLNVDTSALSALSNTQLNMAINPRPVAAYATGGFPTPGEVFLANEPGNPELIGNIGGRTAVVNPTQIVESVSGGVANAVADVLVPIVMNMMGGGNGGDVVVENYWYTSDEKLYQSTQRGKQKADRRYQTINQF